jgi:hydrogenase nickel incorporation protein HypB
MCTTCGCSDGAQPAVIDLGPVSDSRSPEHSGGAHHGHEHGKEHAHSHEHGPGHAHSHPHGHDHDNGHDEDSSDEPSSRISESREKDVQTLLHEPTPRRLRIEQDLLAKNDRLAERNRGWLAARDVVAWNIMSSPGAGKTTLLERTLRDLGPDIPVSVIEGDQATVRDAERIRAAGARAVQINTGSGCHLDAEMVARALQILDPPAASVVIIENVGNLVCPALFDLGEEAKVVLVSVTEGEDKPLKYPHMFRASELMILNKIDLLPYVPFYAEKCVAYARQVNPRIGVLPVSATRGDGLDAWCEWIRERAGAARKAGARGSERP